MADFAAPSGPPPPKAPEVPAGWTARWNEQYKEWFYVNLYTKKSQWDKPTEPAIAPRPDEEGSPDGPPPGYTPSEGVAPTDTKKNPYEDTKPAFDPAAPGSSSAMTEDERLARQLQAEEEARQRSTPIPGSASPYPQQLPPRPQERGSKGSFLGKLLGKAKASAGGHGGSHYGSPQPGYGGYPPQQQAHYGGAGGYYPPQQPGYGGYPGQQPGYYPPQGAYGGGYGGYGRGGYPMGGAHGGRRPGGGMGMAGGAALGLGAGLIGGALVADAVGDAQHDAYAEGYNDGAGGDDFGGGDFGGDF